MSKLSLWVCEAFKYVRGKSARTYKLLIELCDSNVIFMLPIEKHTLTKSPFFGKYYSLSLSLNNISTVDVSFMVSFMGGVIRVWNYFSSKEQWRQKFQLQDFQYNYCFYKSTL